MTVGGSSLCSTETISWKNGWNEDSATGVAPSAAQNSGQAELAGMVPRQSRSPLIRPKAGWNANRSTSTTRLNA
jgi:hypothetical protein